MSINYQSALLSQNKALLPRNYSILFLLCGFIITILRFYLLHLNIWPLNGDEAQYYDWSQHLAFGYYSKPPLLAWLIALSTHVFGNNAFAIRIISPLCHFATASILFLCGRKLFNAQTGFWAGLTYLLVPGVTFSSELSSTDPVLLLFWSASFYFLIQALESNRFKKWLLCGICFGLAMLSKYTAIFLLISTLIYLLSSNKNRHVLKNKNLYLSAIIGLLILLPNIIWNAQHKFASIHAVQSNANLAGFAFHYKNLIYFLLSQFALFGPILFFTLGIILLARPAFTKKDDRYLLLISFIWPLLMVMMIEALLSNAHANWAVAIYTASSILVAAYLVQKQLLRWLWISLLLNIIVFIGFFQAPALIRLVGLKLPVQTEMLNWSNAGKTIAMQLQNHPQSKLLVDDRMLLTLSMYYSHTPRENVFKWNPSHKIADQYDLISTLQQQVGQNFIIVSYLASPAKFASAFAKITPLTVITEPTLDGRSNRIFLYYGQNFLGYNSGSI